MKYKFFGKLYIGSKYLNIEYLFVNHNKFKDNFIINKVKKSLIAKFNQHWLTNINCDHGQKNILSGNKLRTYKKFKTIFSFEDYLNIGSKTDRQIITKFRTSSHDLEIERGRYQGIKAEERTCKLCKSGVEDEPHFLLICPSLKKKSRDVPH